jgi:predicted dehydrogenase
MQRRSFLASAAAAILASPARSATARLRVAQIGTAHPHAAGKFAALRNLPELWEVVGLAEVDDERRARAGKTAPYEGVSFFSEAELLVQPGLRAVAVETRLEDACATARRCLQAGLHVHLDKPGAIEHAEFQAMRLEAERLGLTVQMGYMLRYNPAFELLFRAVREGWLGEITEIDAAMGKLADAGTRAAIGATPGGGMFELACHVIDAVVTLLGKPTSVTGFASPSRDDGVLDNQMAVLQYPRATAVVRCNHADPFGGPRRRFNVTGTEGTLEILPLESGRVQLSLTRARSGYRKGTQSLQLEVPKGRYDREFIDLAAVVRGDRKLAWDAAHDIAVHDTVRRAAGLS